MKEKEPIKVNLVTFLLIIAILLIIIIALCIYIVSLTLEIKTTSDKTDIAEGTNDISNTSVENTTLDTKVETTEKNTDTFPQLAGEFFEIESIAKEYRYKEDIKNYKDFNFDLDSDGTIDKVTLRHVKNEEEDSYDRDYVLEYNGKIIYENWSGLGSAGIVDLDDTDKYLDIWVYDDGPSDDPVYYFYRKVENKIIKMGEFGVEGGFFCDGKGKVLSASRSMPYVSPKVFDCYYTIENNVFKEHSLDFSYNKDYEYTSSDGFFTTDLENLKMFEADESETDIEVDSLIALGEKYNINKLDSNEKFKIIEFVEPADVKIMLSDGTTGYLIHPYGRFYIYD